MVTFNCELDLSGVKDLSTRLTKVKNSHLKYGWINNSKHSVKRTKIKVPTAQIAFWNEFGTKHIPARPYLTITSLVSQTSAIPYIKNYFTDNILNKDYTDKSLDTLASHITKEFKLVKGSGQPLARSTVKKKGNSIHWVESGVLLDEWQAKVYKTQMREE